MDDFGNTKQTRMRRYGYRRRPRVEIGSVNRRGNYNAWLTHHVLVFPNQDLDDTAFEIFAESIGPIGADPFFAPIDGKKRIAAISRRADETGPLFAEVWHSDWSFLETPPARTCLYSISIPPSGSDTLFLNEQKALKEMPASLRAKLQAKKALHSARRAYAPDGKYTLDKYKGSMDIRPSEEALAVFSHPLKKAPGDRSTRAVRGLLCLRFRGNIRLN